MKEYSKCCSSGLLLGRILLSLPFLMGGVSKILDYEGSAGYMASKGMTFIPFFLIAAIIIEILGSIALITGYKARWGALILILFLIPTTLIFHDFWNLTGAGQQMELINFLKNLALIGGLLYVASVGAGQLSLGSCCREEKSCCHKRED